MRIRIKLSHETPFAVSVSMSRLGPGPHECHIIRSPTKVRQRGSDRVACDDSRGHCSLLETCQT